MLSGSAHGCEELLAPPPLLSIPTGADLTTAAHHRGYTVVKAQRPGPLRRLLTAAQHAAQVVHVGRALPLQAAQQGAGQAPAVCEPL